MTTQTYESTRVQTKPVSFGRVLHSEWIKFWSLRSTYWALGVTLVAMVLMAMLMAFSANSMAGVDIEGVPQLDGAFVLATAYYMAQISVAVLGVLVISGEYSTGMIRSSFAATPTRLPVLAAKATVVAVVSFLLGVASLLVAWAVTTPMLADGVPAADLTDSGTLQVIWGTGIYLAGLALLAFGLGAILRHSAGAIAAVLGVMLLLPIIVDLLSLWLDVFADISPYLPVRNGTGAGEVIILDGASAVEQFGASQMLGPWQGLAVFGAYVVVTLVLAAVLVRRRDA